MQDESTTPKVKEPGTLAAIIESMGTRNGVAAAANKALTEAGHKYSLRAIYNTIERNGENNEVIALALFDAIAAAREVKAKLAARRAEMTS